ncbi:MAG: DUF2306 domain-containing protein [Rhizobacter sp.]|nr:DUF2306 domain-containing protein [Chlorobiales bacterium]
MNPLQNRKSLLPHQPRRLRTVAKITLAFILCVFSFLMLRLTLPYLALQNDTAFLQLKQSVVGNPVWKVCFYIHVFTSIFLLAAGFTQFSALIFCRAPQVHRQIGRFYIGIILGLSGPASLVMSLFANGGWSSRIAFTSLSLLWMYVTYRAFETAREKKFALHSAFMFRSFALTLSALTLRAWKYILVLSFALPPMDAYRTVAWLGWIPNLLVAEWLIRNDVHLRLLQTFKALAAQQSRMDSPQHAHILPASPPEISNEDVEK